MLRVVTHRGHRVAIVVAHGARGSENRIVAAELLYEFIHEPAIRRGLFVAIVVILIAGHRHAWRDSKWIGFVGVVFDEAGRKQSVGFRSTFPGVKRSLSRQVEGVWISAKVMIERNVLLKYHHHVLDRSLCGKFMRTRVNRCHRQHSCGDRGEHCKRFNETLTHIVYFSLRTQRKWRERAPPGGGRREGTHGSHPHAF